ncbi:hypothetical protein [Microbacterium testaceum]|nr:hypothetical protein [Microbacterium testaceum]
MTMAAWLRSIPSLTGTPPIPDADRGEGAAEGRADHRADAGGRAPG